MPRRRVKKQKHAVQKRTPKTIASVVKVLVILLVIDGILRIIFASPLVAQYLVDPFSQVYRVRWMAVGLIELLVASGLSSFKRWALYLICGFSLIRIYTVLAFPAQSILFPLQNNSLFYITKIIVMLGVFYLFAYRKYFR